MTVDEALKYVITMGVVAPEEKESLMGGATERIAPVATLEKAE